MNVHFLLINIVGFGPIIWLNCRDQCIKLEREVLSEIEFEQIYLIEIVLFGAFSRLKYRSL